MTALTLKSFFGYLSFDEVVIYREDSEISLYQLISDVITVDKVLPQHQYLLNLYENKYYFLLGLILGLKRGSIQLFPPNTSDYSFNFIEKNYPRILVLNNIKINMDKPEQIDIKDLLSKNNHYTIQQYNEEKLNKKAIDEFLNQPIVNEHQLILFTSGSTGNPKPFTKDWQDFIDVALQLGKKINLEDKPMILSTVPSQHMYGLEVSIINPLVNGLSIYEQRPFYPADIESVVLKQAKNTLLVTTPIHIRACIKTDIKLPYIEATISATAPLSQKLATDFELRYQTQLIEIYGCTELGVTAIRRTSDSQRWLCLEDIFLKKSTDNEFYIQTSRSIGSFILNDYISQVIINHNESSFLLNGRKEDIINIAGKRTSLSYLNHHLLALEQINDACFYQPDIKDDIHQRLIIFIVVEKEVEETNLSSRKALIEQIKITIKDKVDSVFLPRNYFFTDKLPRNKTGKLPHNALKSLYYFFTLLY